MWSNAAMKAAVLLASLFLVIEVAAQNKQTSNVKKPPSVQTFTCPAPGAKPIYIPRNVVNIKLKRMGAWNRLCTLTKLILDPSTKKPSSISPVGRSYGWNPWENVAGAYTTKVKFTCADKRGDCITKLPSSDGPFVLTTYQRNLSAQGHTARLLEQATFGPTRGELNGWKYGHYHSGYIRWLRYQFKEGGHTSHRYYYRQRVNSNWINGNNFAGPTENACTRGSRWRTHTFTEVHRTTNRAIRLEIAGKGNYFIVIDNKKITEVPTIWAAALGKQVTTKILNLCTLPAENIGGLVQMRVQNTPGGCIRLTNPKIYFSKWSAADIVLPIPGSPSFSTVRVRGNYTEGGMFRLNQELKLKQCEKVTSQTHVHAYDTKQKTWYIHQFRILLRDNHVGKPLLDGGLGNTTNPTSCANVARNPFNEHHCRVDYSKVACSSNTNDDNNDVVLNTGLIRAFFPLTKRYVYAINMTEPDESPCDKDSRWELKRVNPRYCKNIISDKATVDALKAALMSAQDGNNVIRDIVKPKVCAANAKKGTRLLLPNRQCWEHVHRDQMTVYDFTDLVSVHSGGPAAITAFAEKSNPILTFPYYFRRFHGQDRWTLQKERGILGQPIGRVGDKIKFRDLPAALATNSVAIRFGARGKSTSKVGVLVCGSPGESANNPFQRDQYDIAVTGLGDRNRMLAQKQNIWTNIALYSRDQLRQRVAWALSQIIPMVPDDIDTFKDTEPFLAYHDIFVRNAFGNYGNILRQISYSPMMAEMLTFVGSKSKPYARNVQNVEGVFPDENFAREIMQLFSIGLVRLNLDGTPVLGRDGKPLETYTNDDIEDGARAWTGFRQQAVRGNMESLNKIDNRIDPMAIVPAWRDPFPKMKLRGGYIGDGYPLCSDLPRQMFLHRGATYRFLGSSPTPELQEEPSNWATDKSIVRVVLEKSSELFGQLCGSKDKSNCQPKLKVVIRPSRGHKLNCVGKECDIDQPRVVKLGDQDLYFEYVRPSCVQYAFYEGGIKIKTRTARNSRSMCADPRLATAGAACCSSSSSVDASWNCNYTGERVSFDTASKRCGMMCSWTFMGNNCGNNNCCAWADGYFWSDDPCQTQAKINNEGKVAVVHSHNAEDVDGDSRILPSLRTDNTNFFRVIWKRNRAAAQPKTDGTCHKTCVKTADGCVCNVTVREHAAFKTFPTLRQAWTLKTSTIHPAILGCKRMNTSKESIVRWSCSGKTSDINSDTIFQLSGNVFRRNMRSVVYIDGTGASFENAPHFVGLAEQETRDVRAETEAVIQNYFRHPNTAPFVAYRLIQRMTVSNPSPRYIRAVATAFTKGKYGSFGSGRYGDMTATVSAVLLDREARAPILDADPSHGVLKEPLLRLTHLMRAMEFKTNPYHGYDVRLDNADKIGQMAHEIPSVFSFFLPNNAPEGRIADASLVSPEAGVANSPAVIGLYNGFNALIKYGLSTCFGGLGPTNRFGCNPSAEKNPATRRKATGQLSFKPKVGATSTELLNELSLLLTAGRLGKDAMATIEDAMKAKNTSYEKLQIAMQLVAASPEFSATNLVSRGAMRTKPKPKTLGPKADSHKSIVLYFMAGGMDSYNLMVPDEDSCPDVYDMYKKTRGVVSLGKSELSGPIRTPGQPCANFRLHKSMTTLKQLYDDGDAILLANTGVLNKPSNLNNWQANHGDSRQFAHDVQQQKTRRMDPLDEVRGGVLGRIADSISKLTMISASAVSVEGGGEALENEGVSPPVNFVSGAGASYFNQDPSFSGMNAVIESLHNSTSYNSGMLADTWSDRFAKAIGDNERFFTALNGAKLKTGDFTSGNKKFEVISKLIGYPERRSVNRDMFYISAGGWDTHANMKANTERNFAGIDASLSNFVAELKAQNKWKDTVVVVASDFARTLTPNGNDGSDHAWGGNYYLIGGGLKGGRMLGQYPKDYKTVDVGRGRLLPTTPWETVWQAIAEWFGVPRSDMDRVLPNRNSFPPGMLLNATDLFNK